MIMCLVVPVRSAMITNGIPEIIVFRDLLVNVLMVGGSSVSPLE